MGVPFFCIWPSKPRSRTSSPDLLPLQDADHLLTPNGGDKERNNDGQRGAKGDVFEHSCTRDVKFIEVFEEVVEHFLSV